MPVRGKSLTCRRRIYHYRQVFDLRFAVRDRNLKGCFRQVKDLPRISMARPFGKELFLAGVVSGLVRETWP